ncbi:DUF3047 domain-containing protein [Acidovorax sp. BL-A-41-H1]|uniref:DUF3047 domain-containing protein n=1 Tax=Acidovorax sp. BL-A-41-H1 TaxID=3421102 RepID=UPI003F78C438
MGIQCSKQWVLAGLLGLLVLGAFPSAAWADDCVALALPFDAASSPWGRASFSKLKKDTQYTLIAQDGRQVLRAHAEGSASMFGTTLKSPRRAHGWLSWAWKTDALVPRADNTDRHREDAPLRVVVAFDGDASQLPFGERAQRRLAQTISGRAPPFAALMYIWGSREAPGTIIPSAHTSQIKMLVVQSGTEGLGQWHQVSRNLREDYVRAFGTSPGPVLGIAAMTDTDNTGEKADGLYADFSLDCAHP